MVDVLPISATAMSSAGLPLFAFHETVRPSADTVSLPSCFLNWAAASDMLGGVRERLARRVDGSSAPGLLRKHVPGARHKPRIGVGLRDFKRESGGKIDKGKGTQSAKLIQGLSMLVVSHRSSSA